jgi:hypothetical protein
MGKRKITKQPSSALQKKNQEPDFKVFSFFGEHLIIFQKKKSKLGKKAAPPQNQTDTSFKAKGLHFQTTYYIASSSGQRATSRKRRSSQFQKFNSQRFD